MKMILVFIIAGFTLVAGLWVFGLIGEEAAGDLFTRTTALVVLVGGAGSLSYLLMKPNHSSSPNENQNSSINSGPKF